MFAKEHVRLVTAGDYIKNARFGPKKLVFSIMITQEIVMIRIPFVMKIVLASAKNMVNVHYLAIWVVLLVLKLVLMVVCIQENVQKNVQRCVVF